MSSLYALLGSQGFGSDKQNVQISEILYYIWYLDGSLYITGLLKTRNTRHDCILL